MASSKRLWEKEGEDTLSAVLKFTVGKDAELDKKLVTHDAAASAAHARMLFEVGLLDEKEVKDLLCALKKVYELAEKNEFEIPPELEDCHGAIEAYLVERVGEAGKKIHTGRSRNDQVLVASRLYLRDNLIKTISSLYDAADVLLKRIDSDGDIEMPGYTHLRPAMPTTISMWLGSFVEWIIELSEDGFGLYQSINSNPLGSASGFGTPLPLDRERTTEILGFDRVQRNPINVQNSRGRCELKVLSWISEIGSLLEKFSWDFILYSTNEFNFIVLPDAITTGSSIMPQKHNPDILELVRARASRIRGARSELEWVISKLPSNYHRDFQYTKEPVFNAFKDARDSLSMLGLASDKFSINKSALLKAKTPELYATYAAFRKVKEGQAFRDAYKETAKDLKEGKIKVEDYLGDLELIKSQTQKELVEARRDLAEIEQKIIRLKERHGALKEYVFSTKKKSWGKKIFGGKK